MVRTNTHTSRRKRSRRHAVKKMIGPERGGLTPPVLVSGAISAETRLFMPPKRANRFWKYLRDSRKHQKVFRGVCGTSANTSVNAAELAQPAQTSRQMRRNLRSLRKRLGKCGGTCAACANVSANAVVLAQLAQTSRKMPRNLRSLRKRLGKCGGTCATCANTKKFFVTLAGLPQAFPKAIYPLLMFDFWP